MRVTIHLSKKLLDDIDVCSEEAGLSRSAYISKCLEAQHKQAYVPENSSIISDLRQELAKTEAVLEAYKDILDKLLERSSIIALPKPVEVIDVEPNKVSESKRDEHTSSTNSIISKLTKWIRKK